MQIRKLQTHLERIYEVEAGHDVDDFLITDAALARHIDDGPDAREIPEKLLVRQEGDCVDVALYLDEALVARLRENDPTERLHDGNLADFWTALEGVSHFLYLLWNARHERSISLMELEMQAEVDKFVTAAVLLGHQQQGRVPATLHKLLFEDAAYDEALDAAGLNRYRDASYYASRYCSRLQSHFMSERRRGGLLNDLRRFYRLTRHSKINHIRAVN